MLIRLIKNLPVFLLLLLVSGSVRAQDNRWIKEVKKLPTPEARFRWIITVLEGGTEYKESYPEMLDMAMQIGREMKSDTLLAAAHLQMGSYYQRQSKLPEAWKEYTTSKLLFLKHKRYKEVASVMYRQSTVLIVQSLADSLLEFLDRHQRFIDAIGSRSVRLRWKAMYPLAYQTSNKNKEAKAAFLELLPLAIENADTQLIISTYINLGRFYTGFDSSMMAYSKGLALAKNIPEKYTELVFKIGYAYLQRDDKLKDSALFYFLEAEKNIDKLQNPVFRCNIEGAIGDYFINREEYTLALPYLRKAYYYAEPISIVHSTTAAHNLVVCFIGLKQPDSAAYYLKVNRKGVMQVDDDYQFMLYYHAKAQFEGLKGDSCSMLVLSDLNRSIAYALKVEEDRVGVSTLIHAVECLLKNDRNKMQHLAVSMLGYCSTYYEPLKKDKTRRLRLTSFLHEYAKLEAAFGDKTKAIQLYEELASELSVIEDSDYIKGLGEAVVKYKSDLKDTEISLLNERERIAGIRSMLIVVGLLVVLCVAVGVFMLYRRETRIRQLLDERNHKVEQLLREVHHRVKNNLQIVSSFINIQLDKVKDNEARVALEDTSTRIMALAGLHQSLYRQGDLSRIQLDQYIRELCNVLGSGINHDVQINCDLDDLQLNIDQAIPIGLAVNELITNALKHAFSHRQHGQINVELKHKEKWELIVKDNGSGLPENMDPGELHSIGIRLVQDIAERQLHGTFSFYNESGAVFKIAFVPLAA